MEQYYSDSSVYEEDMIDEQENDAELVEYEDGTNSQVQSIPMETQVKLIQDGLEKSGQLMQSIENIYEMHQKTKQLKALTKLELARTTAKYKLCHEFLQATFSERHEALQKHYDILDDAIQRGDRELILASLHGISDIVTTSPLSEMQRLASVFDDTSVPLLDF